MILPMLLAAATCSADASPWSANALHNEVVEGITLTRRGTLLWRGKHVRWSTVDGFMLKRSQAFPRRRFLFTRHPDADCRQVRRLRMLIDRHFKCGADRCIEAETPPPKP